MDHWSLLMLLLPPLLTALTEPSYIQTKALKNLLQSNPLQKLSYVDSGMGMVPKTLTRLFVFMLDVLLLIIFNIKSNILHWMCATHYYQYQIRYTTLDVQVFALGSSSWKAIIKLPECPPTYLKKWQHIYTDTRSLSYNIYKIGN